MRSKRKQRAAFAALILVGAAACSGDDDSTTTTPVAVHSPTAQLVVEDPPGFEFAAARRCTDLINGLDHDVAMTGHRARLSLVLAAHEDNEPEEVRERPRGAVCRR